MDRKTVLAITIAALAFGLGPGPAFAQDGKGTGMGMGMGQGMMDGKMGGGGMMRGGGMMGHGGMMGMMGRGCHMMGMMGGGDMPMYREGRVAFLKAELAITDAQSKVWDDYAEALKANMQSMHDMRKTMMGAQSGKTPVERLDSRIAAMESRAAALKEIKPKLAALYDALSDEQKKKADQLLTGMGCMM